MEEKQCKKCEAIKPLSEFSPSKYSLDGFRSLCKECNAEYVRGRYKHNAPKILARRKARSLAAKKEDGGEMSVVILACTAIYCGYTQNFIGVLFIFILGILVTLNKRDSGRNTSRTPLRESQE